MTNSGESLDFEFDEDAGPLNCAGCERIILNLDDAHQISEIDEETGEETEMGVYCNECNDASNYQII
jgi:hypothetical protein